MSKYLIDIRNSIKEVMQDEKVILLGEDICDPFGGCFKVTKGVSTKFPNRVINTPISEAAITGVCTGLALQGFKPILEIMFYDFMTLTMDQILNHMVKFKELWGIDMNITIRTVIGNKDYGVTHCQDLSYLYKNIIDIIYITPDIDISKTIIAACNETKPILLIENSKYYRRY